MTKFSDLKFVPADLFKAIGFTVAVCGFWYRYEARQDDISNKLDQVIAIQKGVDDVQNVRLVAGEKRTTDLEDWRFSFAAQSGTKSRTPHIESEPE